MTGGSAKGPAGARAEGSGMHIRGQALNEQIYQYIIVISGVC